MAIYIVVGEMGMGKSTHIKKRFLSKTKRKISCYNLIANDFEGLPCVNDFESFIDEGVFDSNTLFVVDEASTAIPLEKPNPKKEFGRKLLTWLVNSRKCNNPVFFVFHSLKEIPVWLLMYSNYFIRFNTLDQIDVQKRRFKSYQNIVDSLNDFPIIPKYKWDEFAIRPAI